MNIAGIVQLLSNVTESFRQGQEAKFAMKYAETASLSLLQSSD